MTDFSLVTYSGLLQSFQAIHTERILALKTVRSGQWNWGGGAPQDAFFKSWTYFNLSAAFLEEQV